MEVTPDEKPDEANTNGMPTKTPLTPNPLPVGRGEGEDRQKDARPALSRH
jgi:hypothetical protein